MLFLCNSSKHDMIQVAKAPSNPLHLDYTLSSTLSSTMLSLLIWNSWEISGVSRLSFKVVPDFPTLATPLFNGKSEKSTFLLPETCKAAIQ